MPGLLLRKLMPAAVAACCLLAPIEVKAQSDNPEAYAILIVGDESDATAYGKEKVLIQEMAKHLKKPARFPIYSYHFNKERERSYCEKKLGVLKEDLLFIGVVSLKDRVPRKVVYRIDRIVTPSRAAAEIVARADELTAAPTIQVTPDSSPSPSASPSVSPSPTSGKFRVQLGVFTQQKFAQELLDQLKAKGYDAKFDTVSDGGKDTFKVWVGTFATREDAAQASTELQADGFEKGYVTEVK